MTEGKARGAQHWPQTGRQESKSAFDRGDAAANRPWVVTGAAPGAKGKPQPKETTGDSNAFFTRVRVQNRSAPHTRLWDFLELNMGPLNGETHSEPSQRPGFGWGTPVTPRQLHQRGHMKPGGARALRWADGQTDGCWDSAPMHGVAVISHGNERPVLPAAVPAGTVTPLCWVPTSRWVLRLCPALGARWWWKRASVWGCGGFFSFLICFSSRSVSAFFIGHQGESRRLPLRLDSRLRMGGDAFPQARGAESPPGQARQVPWHQPCRHPAALPRHSAAVQRDAGAQRASRSSYGTKQSTGLSARLIHADKEPISRADSGNKAGCLTAIYGGRLE